MSDIWGGEAPAVDGFDEYTEYMASHGIKVRQVYHPPVEIDGEWLEGSWVVVAERTEMLDDGRVWLSVQESSSEFIASGKGPGWELQARMINENQPPSDEGNTLLS